MKRVCSSVPLTVAVILPVTMVVLQAMLLVACSDSKTSGASPTSPTASTATPSPAPNSSATFVIFGSVTEAQPAAQALSGVTLEMIAGPDTGVSATTDASGMFRFQPLHPGQVGLQASRNGYVPSRVTGVQLDQERAFDIVLYPTPPKDVSGVSATARCNDGSWSWALTSAAACTANGGVAYSVCPGPMCTS
jgi:hypothetical protein